MISQTRTNSIRCSVQWHCSENLETDEELGHTGGWGSRQVGLVSVGGALPSDPRDRQGGRLLSLSSPPLPTLQQ